MATHALDDHSAHRHIHVVIALHICRSTSGNSLLQNKQLAGAPHVLGITKTRLIRLSVRMQANALTPLLQETIELKVERKGLNLPRLQKHRSNTSAVLKGTGIGHRTPRTSEISCRQNNAVVVGVTLQIESVIRDTRLHASVTNGRKGLRETKNLALNRVSVDLMLVLRRAIRRRRVLNLDINVRVALNQQTVKCYLATKTLSRSEIIGTIVNDVRSVPLAIHQLLVLARRGLVHLKDVRVKPLTKRTQRAGTSNRIEHKRSSRRRNRTVVLIPKLNLARRARIATSRSDKTTCRRVQRVHRPKLCLIIEIGLDHQLQQIAAYGNTNGITNLLVDNRTKAKVKTLGLSLLGLDLALRSVAIHQIRRLLRLARRRKAPNKFATARGGKTRPLVRLVERPGSMSGLGNTRLELLRHIALGRIKKTPQAPLDAARGRVPAVATHWRVRQGESAGE